MHIDPANPAAMKSTLLDELDNFTMRHRRRLVHQDVVGQQLLAPPLVTDEELPEDEVMAADFPPVQQVLRVRRRRAFDSTRTGSTLRYRPGPSGRGVFLGCGWFTPARNIRRPGLLAAKCAEALVSRLTHKGLQTKPDRLSVRLGTAGRPGLSE